MVLATPFSISKSLAPPLSSNSSIKCHNKGYQRSDYQKLKQDQQNATWITTMTNAESSLFESLSQLTIFSTTNIEALVNQVFSHTGSLLPTLSSTPDDSSSITDFACCNHRTFVYSQFSIKFVTTHAPTFTLLMGPPCMLVMLELLKHLFFIFDAYLVPSSSCFFIIYQSTL